MSSALVYRMLVAVVTTAVIAAGLYWVVLRNDATAVSSNRAELDVTRIENGPAPTHFDTGQEASTAVVPNGAGADLVVRDGKLTYDPTASGVVAAAITTPDLGAAISDIGAKWVFRPREDGLGSINLVVSHGPQPNNPSLKPPIPMQLVVTPINWNLSIKRDDASPLSPIAAGLFDPPLLVDGTTSYQAELKADGSQLTIELPQGQRRQLNDPRISQWAGNFASFGLYSNDGVRDSIGGFERVWASSKGAEQ